MRRDIHASTTLRAPCSRVREVLVADPGRALSEDVSPEDREQRRFGTHLEVEAVEGTVIEQQIEIETGDVRDDGDAVVLPLSWVASGHERLFPRFEGSLIARPHGTTTQLVLDGSYVIPLGPVGGFGDVVVGRRVARASVERFVQHVADRLDSEVDRRNEQVTLRPAPRPVDLREYIRSEDHIG